MSKFLESVLDFGTCLLLLNVKKNACMLAFFFGGGHNYILFVRLGSFEILHFFGMIET